MNLRHVLKQNLCRFLGARDPRPTHTTASQDASK